MLNIKSAQLKALCRSILVVVEARNQMQRAVEEVGLTIRNGLCFFSIDALKSLIFAVSSILLISISGQAQENNNWFFGNKAGLTFNPNPIPLSGGKIVTSEGCSSISDSNGIIRFYTDGTTVWNKNNLPMSGNTGLLGDKSATQSAIIVPWPGSGCLKYLIFTVDAAENKLAKGLRYSVVDFTSNPLGAVTTLNVPLMQPATSLGFAEKLTAVSDGGSGFWVIAHGYNLGNTSSNTAGNEFYAYHVTSAGPPFTMTTSQIGSSYAELTTFSPSRFTNAAGYMKVSPDGKVLACASWRGGSFVEVFDFNTTNGKVGTITYKKTVANQFGSQHPYGIEFSPNSSKLYVSTNGGGTVNELFQFDVTQTSLQGILIASLPPPGSVYDFGALQLGPNGIIYLARVNKTYLSEISSPDAPTSPSATVSANAAACGYASVGPSLPPGTSCKLGLPNLIQGQFSCDPPACGIVASGSSPCCLGQDSQGNPIYAFLIPVSFQAGTQPTCNLTLTTSQGTIVSYGPTTLSAGTTMVTGTFTVTLPAPSSFCITLKCVSGNLVNCSADVCVALPPCGANRVSQ